MPSTSEPRRLFVWFWLPGSRQPVIAGAAEARDGRVRFGYGRSYLERADAVSLGPELPLDSGWQEPDAGLTIAGALRDGAPDAWGRRVIEKRLGVDENSLSELGYMLESGSDRFGAADFQISSSTYEARRDHASLDELHDAARRLQEGLPLSDAAEIALVRGTSIGGARPKVLVTADDGTEWIAKLSASSDVVFPVVNAEAAALELARRAGLDVPDSSVTRSLGRDVLLVRRFDRDSEGHRQQVLSGLTLARQDELGARYVTYPEILDALAAGGERSGAAHELFDRIAFNIAISNTDDHARNHAAFWDGQNLRLTPAFDLAPGTRSGDTAAQAMAYDREGNRSSDFAGLIEAAGTYELSRVEARARVDVLVQSIRDNWEVAADAARLPAVERDRLWERQILNPAAMYGLGGGPATAPARAAAGRARARGRTTTAGNRGSFRPPTLDEPGAEPGGADQS